MRGSYRITKEQLRQLAYSELEMLSMYASGYPVMEMRWFAKYIDTDFIQICKH
jgi:hypothetical protein